MKTATVIVLSNGERKTLTTWSRGRSTPARLVLRAKIILAAADETNSSWLNMIERWFREITEDRIRRGTFRNVDELIRAMMDYIQQRHQSPKPFVWTAKAHEILAKVQRARKVLDKLQSA